MRVIFLDIDGVLNSFQSAHFWHNHRDQSKWENDGFKHWKGTLREYLAQEFDPIALSNLEEILREVPRVKIVISSTWRKGETVASLKRIFSASPLVARRIIGKTPGSESGIRGREIQWWLDHNKGVEDFVIIDDDSDMEHLRTNLFKTSARTGLDWNVKSEIVNYFKASPLKKRYIKIKNKIKHNYRELRYHVLSKLLGSDRYWRIFR